jgi:ribosomal protein S18 acetylase RimI-like enzyme
LPALFLEEKMVTIRNANIFDLDAVTDIEAECFPKEEAATRKSFFNRLKIFPESFFIAEENNKPIGFINGCVSNSFIIYDEMFEDTSYHNPYGSFQTIFGLDVIPEKRRQGTAGMLIEHMKADSKTKHRAGLTLTCKEHLIHYYEKFGFRNIGVSGSKHGGAVWYDMVLNL